MIWRGTTLNGRSTWTRREEAYQQLMRSLAFSGQRSAALEVYERCRLRLETGLGVEPAEETTELYGQIQAETLLAPLAAATRQTRLPAQLTSFVGRERERIELARRLEDPACRLLTLTGPGGVGKTRLALQVAADVQDDFADGVTFVDLATINLHALVIPTLAHMLGVRKTVGQTLQENVATALHEQRRLIVFDNFEHVISAGSAVAALLQSAPYLTVLVTSRAPLRVSGEQEILVPPLALPESSTVPEPAALARTEAVALFLQRARVVQPALHITDANATVIATICTRLEGLPLAIELAAARSRLFAPEALLGRLGDQLKFLTGGARDLPARQQSIRDTIAWSYGLLSAAQQRLFRRLAVFTGGWTLEAAEGVCDVDGDLSIDIVDGLTALVEQNLLRQVPGSNGEPRFHWLEMISQYALELLIECGERDVLRWQHASYYLRLAEQADRGLASAAQPVWLGLLDAEQGNVRAILAWIRTGYPAEREPGAGAAMALRLAGALWRFWLLRGVPEEWHRWQERESAREIPGENMLPHHLREALWAKVLLGPAVLALYQGAYETAFDLARLSSVHFRGVDDTWGHAAALAVLGSAGLYRGDASQSRDWLAESVALARRVEEPWLLAFCLQHAGFCLLDVSPRHVDQAYILLEESLSLARETGDPWLIAWSLDYLGGPAGSAELRACCCVFHGNVGHATGRQGWHRVVAWATWWGRIQCRRVCRGARSE